MNYKLRQVCVHADLANRALIGFIQYSFESHRPLWIATYAVLAVQNVSRVLKGQLRPAWDSILTWKLSKPVKSRTPMPIEIMKAVCYSAVMSALCFDKSNSHMWLSFAVLVRFAFFASLRPKELYGLLRKHVKVPAGRLLSGSNVAVATVLDPKNRAFMGRIQVRMVRDSNAIAWMSWFVSSLPPETPLWCYSQHAFKTCLTSCLQFYGVDHLGITPASLRAGGATWMLEHGFDSGLSNLLGPGAVTKPWHAICKKPRPLLCCWTCLLTSN